MININIKKPATPESIEEWTSEKIRLQFGNEPEGLVMRLLLLCETQAVEILALKNMIRECETDFLNYSRNSERSTEEIASLQKQLKECNKLQKDTIDKIIGAIGYHSQ